MFTFQTGKAFRFSNVRGLFNQQTVQDFFMILRAEKLINNKWPTKRKIK